MNVNYNILYRLKVSFCFLQTSHAYSSPGLSILRTGVMMLELDYMTSFNDPYSDNDESTLPYKTPTMILLVVFVLIMPILLMNLLVSVPLYSLIRVF